LNQTGTQENGQMVDSDYQINELAKRAGVSVRTIRFYIDEGLLPAPPNRGRYSTYTDEYLDRLELIRMLKDRFLPLKEIRRQVGSLDWVEIKATLAHEREAGKIAQPGEGEENSSALDYINRLLTGSAPTKTSHGTPPQGTSGPSGGTQPPVQPKAPLPPVQEEIWERIRLAPGVELHIQKSTSAINQSGLEQLIDFARRLLYP